jgi:energy-coupling factor transporter ATP-binding protein EcfA2
MIDLDHISYWYPRSSDAALRDVTLRVRDGEAVCVMGRNGSGKSTLVKLIAGLIKTDRGKTTVDGRPHDEGPNTRVGILFQNPDNQMVATLVEKEIAFALENKAMPQAEMETVVAQAARQFGIEHLSRRLTSDLSGGEKQRVALASVMVQEPSVLLLDEPDSFLDQSGRLMLAAELERLHAHDRRLIEIRITQSAQIARQYPRLVVLDGGAIIADGPPAELLADSRLCILAGLTVPDANHIQVKIPGRTGNGRSDLAGRLRSAQLKEATYGWPMSPPVFEKLSAELTGGETVGLIGPTGAGKSTIGLLLAGLAAPSQGEVVYLDSTGWPLKLQEIRGELALVLQQPERQFFLETCAQEVAFGPKNLGRVLSNDEISEYLALVGLHPARYAARDPFSLSSGEKRRLAFAAVLAMEPSLIVFDEPTAGLDGEGVGRFIALSRALKSMHLGQLVISHDGDLIRQVCDRVLYLTRRGELLPLTVAELFGDPRLAGMVSGD